MGTVGYTEDEAIAAGLTCDIYTSQFTPMKISLAGRGLHSFTLKLNLSKSKKHS